MALRAITQFGSALLLATWLCQCQGRAVPPGDPAAAPNEGEPPAASAETRAPPPAPSQAPPAPSASVQTDAGPSIDGATAPADGAASGSSAPPPLLDDAGQPLPQTDERPGTESAFFQHLGSALFEAIVRDDPKVAMPYFFPLVAYQQVKAIERPERDWRGRLVRLFERDIHGYHRHLGRYRDQAEYVGLQVPEERARFMKPHTEGNKLPYWRVLRSHLIYRDHQGRRLRLGVTSLISWRGEWYVVHLNGFE